MCRLEAWPVTPAGSTQSQHASPSGQAIVFNGTSTARVSRLTSSDRSEAEFDAVLIEWVDYAYDGASFDNEALGMARFCPMDFQSTAR